MVFRWPGLAALVIGLAVSLPAANADCLSDWGAAAEVVRANGLQTVEQLAKTSPQQLKGQIIKATLCEEGGGFVYRLVVREATGQMKNVVIDASGSGLAAR